jgi:hypothetical protein
MGSADAGKFLLALRFHRGVESILKADELNRSITSQTLSAQEVLMAIRRTISLPAPVLLAVLLVTGCNRSPNIPAPTDTVPGLGEEELRVSGPFVHENVSVFLIHADKQADGDFITLDEGLKNGSVKVTEQEQERVNELRIDNQSDYPLFLQEGERVQGGKQDRTVVASMVVPPKSGPMPLPAMCIEQGRWALRDGSARFAVTENAALAPREVRMAAKVNKSQAKVWEKVAENKAGANAWLGASYANSSLNETFDSPEVKKLSDACAEALKGVLEENGDAVGVAIAVNGKIEEVNIYPNHRLLAKLYPRLLQSYALQAAVEKDKGQNAKTLDCEAVTAFMKEAREKERPADELDERNRLLIREGNQTVECRTQYKGKAVHAQMTSRPAD